MNDLCVIEITLGTAGRNPAFLAKAFCEIRKAVKDSRNLNTILIKKSELRFSQLGESEKDALEAIDDLLGKTLSVSFKHTEDLETAVKDAKAIFQIFEIEEV